jgi:hypothetical protein
MVKITLTILFSTLLFIESLFPQTELMEIIQLPELFSHFKKHKQERPAMTILEFLSLHYNDARHLASDFKNHQKLPFSKYHHNHIVSFQVIQQINTVYFALEYRLLRQIDAVYYFEPITSLHANPVWQPPRIS